MHKSIRKLMTAAAVLSMLSAGGTAAMAETVGPGAELSAPADTGIQTIIQGQGVVSTAPSSDAGQGGQGNIQAQGSGSTGLGLGSFQAQTKASDKPLSQIAQEAQLYLPDSGAPKADPILQLVPLFSFEMRNHAKQPISGAISYDQSFTYSESGFASLYLLHQQVGRYYYRCYTTAHGWSPWATSGETTPAADDTPVQAVQIRVKGYTHTLVDVYYRAVLNDGTVLDWAKDGEVLGTMGTDKYIVALKIALWDKQQAFALPRERRLLAAHGEGLYTDAQGQLQYSHFDGTPYTGWAYDADSSAYYFREGERLSGWQDIDGYRYYFDEHGTLVKDLEPIMGLQARYQIHYNKSTRTMYIMTQDESGRFTIPYKTFMTTSSPSTPVGDFHIYAKYRWKIMHDDIYCQFLNRFYNGYIIHSLLYYGSPSPYKLDAITYNFMDDAISDGCIRLRAVDAEWVYKNCKDGTLVHIYEDRWNKGPVEKDAITQVIPRDQNYDPTDSVVQAQMQAEADAAARAQAEAQALAEAANASAQEQAAGEPRSPLD